MGFEEDFSERFGGGFVVAGWVGAEGGEADHFVFIGGGDGVCVSVSVWFGELIDTEVRM